MWSKGWENSTLLEANDTRSLHMRHGVREELWIDGTDSLEHHQSMRPTSLGEKTESWVSAGVGSGPMARWIAPSWLVGRCRLSLHSNGRTATTDKSDGGSVRAFGGVFDRCRCIPRCWSGTGAGRLRIGWGRRSLQLPFSHSLRFLIISSAFCLITQLITFQTQGLHCVLVGNWAGQRRFSSASFSPPSCRDSFPGLVSSGGDYHMLRECIFFPQYSSRIEEQACDHLSTSLGCRIACARRWQ